jgi:AcrR family transcriptional regulator
MESKAMGRPRQTTHDRIREVAVELFAKHGYAATSLAEVALAAGISRTTLFSYFPAKRDLLWEDHERAVVRVREALDQTVDGSIVDLLVAGMVAASRYDATEHDMFAMRRRIVQNDDELRAYAALRSEELLQMLVAAALRRAPEADPELVDNVTRALMAVASRGTEVWSTHVGAQRALDEFTADRLEPIAAALKPLLP